MPTIGAAVNVEIKEKFETVARELRTTTSRLAASLIMEFLVSGTGGRQPSSQETIHHSIAASGARGETKTEQVFVRLEPYYFAELGRLASERNWYRSTYLANLFHAHADRRPVLCEVEINAVRQVARQLADLGRNINQIARKLNVSLENSHLTLSVDFELVRMLVELEASAIKSLMKANLKGWGVTDGEA
jgi:hypothetical protein